MTQKDWLISRMMKSDFERSFKDDITKRVLLLQDDGFNELQEAVQELVEQGLFDVSQYSLTDEGKSWIKDLVYSSIRESILQQIESKNSGYRIPQQKMNLVLNEINAEIGEKVLNELLETDVLRRVSGESQLFEKV